MQPPAIHLYRRRWTLYFQVPFTVLMALTTAYSVFLAVASNDRLLTLIGAIGAFGSFCITWTLARSAWDAHQNREPALIIDAQGILDLRQDDPQTVRWNAMESVHINFRTDAIVARLRHGNQGSITQALQRAYRGGGDVAFSLHGLAHDTSVIQSTLKAFHEAAVPPAQRPA